MSWKNLQEITSLRLPKEIPGLHHRSDLHLSRKLFHMSGAIILLVPYLVFHAQRETIAAILGAVLAMSMSLEYMRSRSEWVNSVVVRAMGPIMRDTEINELSGNPFYLASCLFAFLIFPRHITVLSVLYLALGDPSSSFFGVLFGRNKIFPNKSLQGTLGGFFVCAIATFVYLYLYRVGMEKILVLSLLGGFAGALSELLPLNVDDNLAIPIISGFLMYFAFWAANLATS